MNIIEVENLKKSYGEIKAVKGISFTVEEGSLFAFLGVNGAGKSTTINILCSITRKDEGTVKICGYDLANEKYKESIGVVFQGSVLDKKLTVYENLVSRACYYNLHGEKLKARLEELSKLMDLDCIMKQKYENLSGGQRRRVDIARALLNQPKILFLDEPTTGLDPQSRIMVWKVINDLRRETNLTVFLTTHYMEETVDADKVVIIDNGEIVASDTPHNLKEQFTYNYIKVYKEKDENFERSIKDFEYKGDAYYIKFEQSKEVIDFIIARKDELEDFEVIKGDMDDVFLTVTGKKLMGQ